MLMTNWLNQRPVTVINQPVTIDRETFARRINSGETPERLISHRRYFVLMVVVRNFHLILCRSRPAGGVKTICADLWDSLAAPGACLLVVSVDCNSPHPKGNCTPHHRGVSTCVTYQLVAVWSSTLTVRIRTRRLPRSPRVPFRFARSTAAYLSRGSVC